MIGMVFCTIFFVRSFVRSVSKPKMTGGIKVSKPQYLEAGKIINKRGLAGELKIESYCDSPDVFASFPALYLDREGNDRRKVLSAKVYRGFAYLRLAGVESAEEADRLKNRMVYVDRADVRLDETRTLVADLVGLPVIDADTGVTYGIIAEVFNRGASDIYRIVGQGACGNGEYLFPAVKQYIVSMDLEHGVLVRPIPGLFDDAEEV